MANRKWVLNILKVLLSAAAVYFAFQLIDLDSFQENLRKTKVIYVVVALLLYIGSQTISSFRLLLILNRLELKVPKWWNLELYFIGMSYNLFLPGGVGGDAYKMLAYSQKLKQPIKRFILPLIADRVLGLIAILAILVTGIAFIPGSDHWWNSTWFILAIPIGLPLSYWIVKKWFAAYRRAFFPGVLYSLVIQTIQIAGIGFIAYSVGYDGNWWILCVIFLISTLATIIPVFLGGLGAREIVFASLFPIFDQSSEMGVLISVLFSILLVVSSLPGLLFALKQKLD